MFKRILASVAVSVLPLSVFAQTVNTQTVNTTYQGGGVGGLLKWFSGILSLAVPVIIALAVVWFIFSIFMYVIASNEEGKAKAKGQIIWGIVGLFIIVSVWGLVGILSSTFNLSTAAPAGPTIPVLQ
jgi:preprotein translocase subunit SecG